MALRKVLDKFGLSYLAGIGIPENCSDSTFPKQRLIAKQRSAILLLMLLSPVNAAQLG